MPLSVSASAAIHAAIGTCLSSSLVLVPALRGLFSPAAQTILPQVASLAAWYVGGTLEETMQSCAEGVVGTLLAVANVAAWRSFTGMCVVDPHSWASLLVVLEATLFTGVLCLLPLADNTKMSAVGDCATFMLAIFSGHSDCDHFICTEYTIVMLLSWLFLVLGFSCPVPYVTQSISAPQRTAGELDIVASSCSELILEATKAFLNGEGGAAWRTLAHAKLSRLSRRLDVARENAGYQGWSPAHLVWSSWRQGRLAMKVLQLQGAVALRAAEDAVDVCRLLIELTTRANTRDETPETAAVRQAASAGLTRVIEGAIALLRDFVGTQLSPTIWSIFDRNSAAQFLKEVEGNARRHALRKELQAALRGNSKAAQDLLALTVRLHGTDNTAVDGDLVCVHADTACFLFLVHALAADMLRFEAETLNTAARMVHEASLVERIQERKAKKRVRSASAESRESRAGKEEDKAEEGEEEDEEDEEEEEEDEEGDDEEAEEDDEEAEEEDEEDEVDGNHTHNERREGWKLFLKRRGLWRRSTMTWLAEPFITKPVPEKSMPLLGFSCLREVKYACWGVDWKQLCRMWESARMSLRRAVERRGRNALKCAVAFGVAFAGSVYLWKRDDTTVNTVALLCSYGTQYAGGSLRQSVHLGVGIAGGAALATTIGGVITWCCVVPGQGSQASSLEPILTLWAIFLWIYFTMFLNYMGGTYAYAGFNAAYTGISFLLDKSTHFTHLVKYNLFGCILTVIVELGVFPVWSERLLRSRLAVALTGVSACLSSLVTSSVRKGARSVGQAPAHKPLPDLTQRLDKIGALEEYLQWHEGYCRWRSGGATGAHGELAAIRGGPGSGAVVPRRSAQPRGSARVRSWSAPTHGYADAAGEGDGPERHQEDAQAAPFEAAALSPTARGQAVVSPLDELFPFELQTSGEDFMLESVAAGSRHAFEVGPGASEEYMLEPFASVMLPSLTEFGQLLEDNSEQPRSALETLEQSPLVLPVDPAFITGVAEAQFLLLDEGEGEVAQEAPLSNLATMAGVVNTEIEQNVLADLPCLEKVIKQKALNRSVSFSVALEHNEVAESPRGSGAVPGEVRVVVVGDIRRLLQEVRDALEPTARLAMESTESCTRQHIDASAWVLLAESIDSIRLRLLVLARIAHRLRGGVSIDCLLGSEGADTESSASQEMVKAFGMALSAATVAVAGGGALWSADTASIERRLLKCARTLVKALVARQTQTARGGRGRRANRSLAAEVLAWASGSMLVALLHDAASVLTEAMALSEIADDTGP